MATVEVDLTRQESLHPLRQVSSSADWVREAKRRNDAAQSSRSRGSDFAEELKRKAGSTCVSPPPLASPEIRMAVTHLGNPAQGKDPRTLPCRGRERQWQRRLQGR